MLALTGSPAQAGAVAGIRGLVYVVWAISAGVLIDRWDRRPVMFVANLGRFAALPNVVAMEQFPAAAAQTGTADQIARLVGPPLGGFFYQTVGGFVTFALDTLSYVVNARSIFAIDTPLRAISGVAKQQERQAIRHEITTGIVWL